MNPEFRATQTSPILEMLQACVGVYSHSGGFKAVDRIEYYEAFANFLKSGLESFYDSDQIVFDKNRGWPIMIKRLDEILDHSDSKILWTYRDPVHVVQSMEKRHRQTPLIQFVDEAHNQINLSTLAQRINHWIGDNSIMGFPTVALSDAIEAGYEDRIKIIDYKQLCSNPEKVMKEVHEFLDLKPFDYAKNGWKDLKQSTHEHDNLYNYKFPHDITEGKISYSEPDFEIPESYVQAIQNRFKWLTDHCKKVKNEQKKNATRQLRKGKVKEKVA